MNGKKVLKSSLSQLYKNPKHTHLNRSLSSNSILNRLLLNNVKMGLTNVPVSIETAAENHPVNSHELMTNGNQKWASSLAAQLNNVDSSHKNHSPLASSPITPPSPVTVEDMAILMGNPSIFEGNCC
jgi:hypothetical protein